MGGEESSVKMRYDDNIETTYGHLSEFNVKERQKVMGNQVIRKVGNTGSSTGPHMCTIRFMYMF